MNAKSSKLEFSRSSTKMVTWRLSIGIVVTGKRTDRVCLGRFKGKDSLRSLVFGDGEVVFGEPVDHRTAFLVEHRYIQKDQGRRHPDCRRVGRSLLTLSG